MPMETLCADQPGKCFTFEEFAEDVIDLMDQLKIEKAHIVGHSMGSIILQTLALTYPDRVSSITLISTIIYTEHNAMIQDILIRDMMENTWKKILTAQPDFNWPADAYLKKPHELGEEVKAFLKDNWVTEACTDQWFLDAVYPETISVPLGTWIGSLNALGGLDNRDALKKLEVPTLVLWASQDVMFDKNDQELVKATLKTAAQNGNVKIIHKTYGKQGLPEEGYPLAEVGHNLQWAAPTQVAEDIISFLRSGFPVMNLPYANPENMKEIKVEKTHAGVDVL
jgi:pimeloyl-ACP methyl ester carboxylesterase